jgi:hypothetical protein
MREDAYLSKVIKAWADQAPEPPGFMRRRILMLAIQPKRAVYLKSAPLAYSGKISPGDWTRLVSVWDSPLLYQFGFTGTRLVI